MKIKTIRSVIKKKIHEWLESIQDKDLREMLKDEIIVTGGSIASMLRKETVNDYDIYLKSEEAVLAVTKYYAKPWLAKDVCLGEAGNEITLLQGIHQDQYRSTACYALGGNVFGMAVDSLTPDRVALFFNGHAGYPVPEKIRPETGEKYRDKYSPLFFSPNAITLTDQIQIIIRFYGKAEDIHKNFDFVHTTNYFDSATSELHTRNAALESLLTGELVYVGSLYPLTSIIRTKKFLQRGYTISAGEYVKMSFQVSLLDLTDPAVLSDQLAGVDIAYFTALINALLKMKEENPEFIVTPEWISGMINELFQAIDHSEDSD